MKTLLIAAAFAVMGAGASLAQGLPAGTTPPVYGADAFPNARYHDHTVFSDLLRGSHAGEIKTGHSTQAIARTERQS